MDLAEQASGIGCLADPTRRLLYEYVVGRTEPVGREEAAAELELAVSTAGFHLDKLVAQGLLETEYRRRSGRTGPGAGRPSKLYFRGSREFSLSLPARRYDLVAQILATAFARASTGADLPAALATSASDEGVSLGAEARAGGAGAEAAGLMDVLATQGYEPRINEACIELGNCPFDALAQRHTELVCGVNLHFIEGLCEGLGSSWVHVELAPAADRCCVAVRGATAETSP